MINITYFLSNRASYYRSKLLLDTLNRDLGVELNIIITSSLIVGDCAQVGAEIRNRYTNVATVPFNGYDGSLYGMAHCSGRVALLLSEQFKHGAPDLAICYADRFELLPFAMVCSYMRIPLAQIQAGEDSGNIDQKVRHAVSHLADIRFASHRHAQKKLEDMGLGKDSYNTGCPSIDMIKHHNINKINKQSKYIICMFHPHTKESFSADVQMEIVIKHVDLYCKETENKCYFFAPNNDPGSKRVKEVYENNPYIELISNVNEAKYLSLLAGAKCIVGNSSSGLREASYLAIPAVNVGNRQENRICGKNVIHSEFSGILDNIHKAVKMDLKQDMLFGDGIASTRIVERIKEWLTINKKKDRNFR